jgi:hypothetical protein
MPLLPYATVKPHDPQACPQNLCHPHVMGHWVCMNSACPGRAENSGTGRAAYLQTLRHATDAEYATLPLAHIPVDGIARKPVFMCEECAEETEAHTPFCAHPAPKLPACPKCAAGADQQCVRKDGVTALGFNHGDRPAQILDTCLHAHRPDCAVFEGCQCSGNDEPPARPPHPSTLINDGNGPDISRLLIEPGEAQMLLQREGVHWWQVRRVDSRFTQLGHKPCIWAEVAETDEQGHIRFDADGHEILREVVIVIELPPPGQIGAPRAALPPADAAPLDAPPGS